MAKITLSDPANLINSSAITTIANNNALIEGAIENTLSRNGTAPNEMEANLDMNSFRILNLLDPTTNQEPVTVAYLQDYIEDNFTTNDDLTGVLRWDIAQSLTTEQKTQVQENIGLESALRWDIAQSLTAAQQTQAQENIGLVTNTPEFYGASGSDQTTTGTISASSTSLTLADALDFKNGQGVLVLHAGTTVTLAAPANLAVAQFDQTGAKTVSYKVAAVDQYGGIGPVSTVTTTTSPTFLNDNDRNDVTWDAVTGAYAYIVYADYGSGYIYIGGGSDGLVFYDKGLIADDRPFWVPETPPTAVAHQWLKTSIASGAGTTTLVLADAAINTATTQTVLHDDTDALNDWIAAINAGDFVLAETKPGATYRTSVALDALTVSDVELRFHPTSVFLPAGVTTQIIGPQWVIGFYGTGTNSDYNGGTVHGGYCLKGNVNAVAQTTWGDLAPGDYLEFAQNSAGAVYYLYTEIRAIQGDQLILASSAPVAFCYKLKKITLGGSVTPAGGDVININFVSPTHLGGTTTVTYTTLAGDTLDTVTAALGVEIHNTGWGGVVTAFETTGNGDTGVPIVVNYPHVDWDDDFSLTSTGTTGTVTVTFADDTTPDGSYADWVKQWIPIERVKVSGLHVNGYNVVGRNAQSPYAGLWLTDVAHSTVENIYVENCHGSPGVHCAAGYKNTFHNIQAISCGDGGWNDLAFSQQSSSNFSNILSIYAGFGPGFYGTAYCNASNIEVNAATGRGVKLAASLFCNFVNLNIKGCQHTGLGITWGSCNNQFTNVMSLGNQNVNAAGDTVTEAVWFSDSYNCDNVLCNIQALWTATNYDIAVFNSDTGNKIVASRYGTINNLGEAVNDAGTILA